MADCVGSALPRKGQNMTLLRALTPPTQPQQTGSASGGNWHVTLEPVAFHNLSMGKIRSVVQSEGHGGEWQEDHPQTLLSPWTRVRTTPKSSTMVGTGSAEPGKTGARGQHLPTSPTDITNTTSRSHKDKCAHQGDRHPCWCSQKQTSLGR